MKIAKYLDHTNISRDATEEDIKKLCDEAKQYNFRGVCVNPEWTAFVKKQLEGTDIKVVILIDPPMGLSSHEERIKVCEKAVEEGADNLDIVMNIVDLKYERYDKILEDLKEVAKLQHTKVIIGSGYLTDKEVAKASKLVKESGAACVKTATEKDPLQRRELDEKARHVEIMSKNAPGLSVKVAGKIRNLKDSIWMIENGADVIGTSTGVQIAEEEKNL